MSMEKELLEKLINHALKLLSRRQQSEQELRSKLTRYLYKKKVEESELYVNAVTEYVRNKGVLDDAAYAEMFSRDRLLLKPRSKKMLRTELTRKGIAEETIEKILNEYDEEEAFSKVIEKKSHYASEELTTYLLRQGFPYDLVRKLVENKK
jgi:regulatory protein